MILFKRDKPETTMFCLPVDVAEDLFKYVEPRLNHDDCDLEGELACGLCCGIKEMERLGYKVAMKR